MNDDPLDLESVLRRHFDEHDHVPDEAVASAHDLFGLRRLDDELIELTESMLATRDDDAGGDDVLRYEFRAATVLVRRLGSGSLVEVIVTPPGLDVAIESAMGTTSLEFDADGMTTIELSAPARIRIRLPDGASGVTDGLGAADAG